MIKIDNVKIRECLSMLGALHSQSANLAFEEVWKLQDGYGTPGYTPPQGYDWSGIRDSSNKALKAMFISAWPVLVESGIVQFIGEPGRPAEYCGYCGEEHSTAGPCDRWLQHQYEDKH